MDYNISAEITQQDLDKFANRKLFALLVAEAWERHGNHERAARIRACGEQLVFGADADGRWRLLDANFCRDRVCSMCAWRRSLRLYAQVSAAMEYLEAAGRYSYIFATLTLRNVGRDELSRALDHLQRAYKRMFERQEIERAVKGWYRATEVTYNAETDTYHPHIHVVCVVNRSYYTSRDYLRHDIWTALWQQSARVNYQPIVDIRRVSNKQDKGYAAAVAEIAKYAVKPAEAIDPRTGVLRDDVIITMANALHGRRLVGWGGVLRDAHRATRDVVPITSELTDVRPDVVKGLVRYQWGGTGYNVGA